MVVLPLQLLSVHFTLDLVPLNAVFLVDLLPAFSPGSPADRRASRSEYASLPGQMRCHLSLRAAASS